VEKGTYHRYTFYTDKPIPAGFQMTTVVGGDVQTTPVVAENNEYSFNVFEDYSFLALQYMDEAPSSVHFNRITREVLEIDPTAVEAVNADDITAKVIATQIYTVAGQSVSQMSKGVNLIRETLDNGKVRTRKVMVK
jgi:hypothetical protein